MAKWSDIKFSPTDVSKLVIGAFVVGGFYVKVNSIQETQELKFNELKEWITGDNKVSEIRVSTLEIAKMNTDNKLNEFDKQLNRLAILSKQAELTNDH